MFHQVNTCIPSYPIGPWPGNPNVPANQNFVFKITRTPVQNTGTPVNTGLGHIGVWSNGVSIFNALDAMSYNNQNVWHQNAEFWEGSSFDNCLGHPAPNGEYHHHVNPTCLYDDNDSLHHSPIIGYAFDGFPIYGAYGFDNPNSTGTIRRMLSSYQERNITTRDTLPNGNVASSPGPAVGGVYGIGAYVEDYIYIPGSGDLDQHNGRFCVTPDYPNGIYAYFVTIDENQNPAYPYVLGTSYYGIVQSGNTGPNSGHNVPTETVVTYDPTTGISTVAEGIINIYPNPVRDHLNIRIEETIKKYSAVIIDINGREILKADHLIQSNRINTLEFPSGIYYIKIISDGFYRVMRFVKN